MTTVWAAIAYCVTSMYVHFELSSLISCCRYILRDFATFFVSCE